MCFRCICTARAAAQDGISLPLRAVRFQCDAWIDEDGLRAQLPLVLGEALTPGRSAKPAGCSSSPSCSATS
jgi:hypothetical protein